MTKQEELHVYLAGIKLNKCLRIYTCGEAKLEPRSDADLPGWLAHNRFWRPGNALFVNGICLLKERAPTLVFDQVLDIHDRGYFALNHIEWIETQLKDEANMSYKPYGFFSTWRRDKLTRDQQ